MRSLVPFLSLLFGFSFAASGAEDIGSAVSTDDICAVRPDICAESASRHKRKKKRPAPSQNLDFADFDTEPAMKTASVETASTRPPAAENPVKKKKKKKKSNDPLADFWEDETKDEHALLDIERAPAQVIKPMAVAVMPSAPRKRISFSSYMNANSGNAALSSRYAGRQDAFQQAIRPATLTAPPSMADDGSAGSGQSVREPAPPQVTFKDAN